MRSQLQHCRVVIMKCRNCRCGICTWMTSRLRVGDCLQRFLPDSARFCREKQGRAVWSIVCGIVRGIVCPFGSGWISRARKRGGVVVLLSQCGVHSALQCYNAAMLQSQRREGRRRRRRRGPQFVEPRPAGSNGEFPVWREFRDSQIPRLRRQWPRGPGIAAAIAAFCVCDCSAIVAIVCAWQLPVRRFSARRLRSRSVVSNAAESRPPIAWSPRVQIATYRITHNLAVPCVECAETITTSKL